VDERTSLQDWRTYWQKFPDEAFSFHSLTQLQTWFVAGLLLIIFLPFTVGAFLLLAIFQEQLGVVAQFWWLSLLPAILLLSLSINWLQKQRRFGTTYQVTLNHEGLTICLNQDTIPVYQERWQDIRTLTFSSDYQALNRTMRLMILEGKTDFKLTLNPNLSSRVGLSQRSEKRYLRKSYRDSYTAFSDFQKALHHRLNLRDGKTRANMFSGRNLYIYDNPAYKE
jgi:hypothetical protein